MLYDLTLDLEGLSMASEDCAFGAVQLDVCGCQLYPIHQQWCWFQSSSCFSLLGFWQRTVKHLATAVDSSTSVLWVFICISQCSAGRCTHAKDLGVLGTGLQSLCGTHLFLITVFALVSALYRQGCSCFLSFSFLLFFSFLFFLFLMLSLIYFIFNPLVFKDVVIS